MNGRRGQRAPAWAAMLALCALAGVATPGRGAEHAPAGADSSGERSFLDLYTLTNGFTNGRPRSVTATKDGSTVYFLRSGPRDRVQDLYAYDVKAAEEHVVFTAESVLHGAAEHLSAAEQERRERARQSARGIASYELSPDDRRLLVPLAGRLFVIERAGGDVRELTGAQGAPLDPHFSPDGSHVACVRNGDLYVYDAATGAERRLTDSATEDVSNGLAEFAAQEEMLRRRGYWWSPDGSAILCEQADTSPVEKFRIPDLSNPQKAPHIWPYPRAGRANAIVKLAILPLDGGAPVWVDWDRARFPYLVTVRWEPNAPPTLVVHDRHQENARVLVVDAATGKTRELLREHDPAWLQFEQSVPHWRADGKAFLWSTERGGDWRLELRDRGGRLIRALTRPPLRYRKLAGIDEASNSAIVQASANDPTERHLWRVPLDGHGGPQPLAKAPGDQDATMHADRAIFAVEHQGRDGSYRMELRTVRDGVVGALRSVAQAPPFEPNVEWLTLDPPLRMRASIVRPRDFVEGRRYPVLVHVYGGPYHQEVRATRQRYLFEQWFADQGFVVVATDGRGTPGRGRAWERAIDGDLIEIPLADQVAAVRQLGARFPEMDMDRVGIWGWSFGGYFSAMAVMRHPELFKAGIAGAPVADWRDYSTYYTERYMNLPDENPKGYANASVLTWAPRLERPLLIIHGTADDNVYFMHSAKIADALFRAGKTFEFLPLSQFTHMVVDVEARTRMYERMHEFLEKNLSAKP